MHVLSRGDRLGEEGSRLDRVRQAAGRTLSEVTVRATAATCFFDSAVGMDRSGGGHGPDRGLPDSSRAARQRARPGQAPRRYPDSGRRPTGVVRGEPQARARGISQARLRLCRRPSFSSGGVASGRCRRAVVRRVGPLAARQACPGSSRPAPRRRSGAEPDAPQGSAVAARQRRAEAAELLVELPEE